MFPNNPSDCCRWGHPERTGQKDSTCHYGADPFQVMGILQQAVTAGQQVIHDYDPFSPQPPRHHIIGRIHSGTSSGSMFALPVFRDTYQIQPRPGIAPGLQKSGYTGKTSMVAPGSTAWHKHSGHISGNGKNPERLRETIPAWVFPFLEIIHLPDKFGLVVTKLVFITLRKIISGKHTTDSPEFKQS